MDNQVVSSNNGINNNVSNAEISNTVKEKKVNVLAIVFGIVALLLGGVAIFFGVKYFEPKEEDEPIEIERIEEKTKIEIVKDTMAKDYKEVVSVVKSLTDGIENVRGNYYQNSNDLMYKPEDLNTFIPTRLVVKTELANSDSSEVNIATLKTRLENAGFESIGTLPNLGSAPTPDEYGYLNSSSNIVCSLMDDAEWASPTVHLEFVTLRCAKTDWTWLAEDDKTLISELETAYREKEGEYPIELDIGVTREIKDSEYKPYQTLRVGLKGMVGLFYRTDPDAEWQFLAGVQAPLECSEYNTEDLKKAFAGDTCYNGLEELTVQP